MQDSPTILQLSALIGDFMRAGRAVGHGRWLTKHDTSAAQNSPGDNLADRVSDCAVRIMTANVNTLLQEGRLEQLDQQFADAGVHLAGIQEAREQGNWEHDEEHFVRYSSGATTDGQGGTQLWVAKSLKVKRVEVEPVSSRILGATVTLSSGLRLAVVVAHGPIEADAETNKHRFWDQLQVCLEKLRHRSPKALPVVLADFNARVGSVEAPCLGIHGAETENENGALLRHFLCANELVAVNTLHPIGCEPTWYGPNQAKGHRIDYIATHRDNAGLVTNVTVDVGLDLATAAKTDHVAVRCDLLPLEATSDPKQDVRLATGIKKIDPISLHDVVARKRFEQRVAQGQKRIEREWACRGASEAASPMAIDERTEAWTTMVQHAANSSFKAASMCKPNKRWITDRTWSIVRRIAPLRREFVRTHCLQHRFTLQCLLMAWRAVHSGQPTMEIWACQCDFALSRFNFRRSSLYVQLCCLRASSRAAVRDDKQWHLYQVAALAQTAADACDTAAVYRQVRLLKGIPPKTLDAVKLKDGTTVTAAADVESRWYEHFAEVFAADVVPNRMLCVDEAAAERALRHRPDLTAEIATPTWDEINEQIMHLPPGKGVGPDGISAEMLRAAGPPAVSFLQALWSDAWSASWFPTRWRGGFLQKIWKRKGDASDCDANRGILLADHCSKVGTGVAQQRVHDAYLQYIPLCQYGCAKHRGTAQASLYSSVFWDACAVMERSAAILFLDLSKAFDLCVREVLFGWRDDFLGDKADYLHKMGVDKEFCQDLVNEINRSGGLLAECGVDLATRRVIASLHQGSWFTVGNGGNPDAKPALVTTRGGRQGCRLGAIVFNWVYARCLRRLRGEMQDAGIVLHMAAPSDVPFWDDNAHSRPATPADLLNPNLSTEAAVEATYVDDEALFLSTTTPAQMQLAVSRLLELVDLNLRRYGFKVNWSKGKSELMLKLRGKGARHVYAEMVSTFEGSQVIVLPSGGGILNVVPVYKHVGTTLRDDGSLAPEVNRRCSEALSIFLPLAKSLFGCAAIAPAIRIHLAESLVFSRLFFNSCVWPALPVVLLNRLNAVYLRVLRRIHGSARGGGGWQTPDRVVLEELDMPTLADRLRRDRLSFLPRVLSECATPIRFLLAVRGRTGDRVGWAAAIRDDLRDFATRNSMKVESLGDPTARSLHWQTVIASCPAEWKEMVSSTYAGFQTPPWDVVPRASNASPRPERCDSHMPLIQGRCNFACQVCGEQFSNAKARDLHARVKHQIRTFAEDYVGATPMCPVCGRSFADRLRTIAHLSDLRVRNKVGRPPCGVVLRSGSYPKVPPDVLAGLRGKDTSQRADARKQGRTRPVVGFAHHAHAPKQAEAVRRPKRRLTAKTPSAAAAWVWVKRRRTDP